MKYDVGCTFLLKGRDIWTIQNPADSINFSEKAVFEISKTKPKFEITKFYSSYDVSFSTLFFLLGPLLNSDYFRLNF